MNQEVKAQWVTALRSDEYKQGRGYLVVDGNSCCLGVLCDLAVKAGVIEGPSVDPATGAYAYGEEKQVYALPAEVREWADLGDNSEPRVRYDWYDWNGADTFGLSALNDGKRLGFREIADLIDSQL